MSYNFRHRFTEETVDRVFAWILDEVAKAGYLSPKAVFIDGTHIKANANTKKQMKEQIPAAARHYAKELMEEVNADREAHGKKPFDDDNDPPASPRKHKDNTSKKKLARRKKQGFRTVTKSVTDPDCGLFVKGEHKRQFAYEAHTACDKNGFVLETVVTPGNVHDSVAFDEVYNKVTENFPQVEAVVADAAYKTPHICKKVFGDGRVLSTAYKRPQTMKNGHESLCCFFAHICSRPSLLLSTDRVPRQTDAAAFASDGVSFRLKATCFFGNTTAATPRSARSGR